VMSGSSSGRHRRPVLFAVPLLAGVLSGCGGTEVDPYPSHLRYLPRTDPIVKPPAEAREWTTDGPGQLDQAIARIGPKDKGGIGGEALDPKQLPAERRKELESALDKVFNTPRLPHVDVEESEAEEYRDALQLSRATLREGSKLYRRHCLHCHGLNGDGRGPTGPWLNPHPRDYRQGVFKFLSTEVSLKPKVIRELKPRRADLLRTLRQGVEGTSMPSFGLQSDEELNQIVSYVIHLSLRGQVEYDTIKALFENTDPATKKIDLEALEGGSIATHVQSRVGELLKAWAKSDTASNVPPPYPYKEDELAGSIQRGYELFTNKKNPLTSGACIECHSDFGRQVPFRYDAWGTLVRPANLTAGVYRGGRRPIDLFWRIRSGIDASTMPAVDFDPARVQEVYGKEKKIEPYWDLVNFLQALPYPNMLPREVRDKIYMESAATPPAHAAAE
jgi:mono/diheme cytochrome c family protein